MTIETARQRRDRVEQAIACEFERMADKACCEADLSEAWDAFECGLYGVQVWFEAMEQGIERGTI